MSDDYTPEDEMSLDEAIEFAEENSIDIEMEEISSDEVDRVVTALESLMESVESENIRSYLEEASNEIYYLIYEDEVDGEQLEEAA
jgi:hypothetical protein